VNVDFDTYSSFTISYRGNSKKIAL
jgi:hypothetical protein